MSAVAELIAMLEATDREEGSTIFNHTPEEIGLHVMENHEAILAVLRTPDAPVCLPPDQEDIRLVLNSGVPRCPCCKGTPATFARYFEHSKIFQSYVHCSRCMLQVFVNSRDREDARSKAIAAWSRRPAAHEDEMLERLRMMSKQRTTAEMDEEDRDNADYEGAYNWFCDESRAIFAALGARAAINPQRGVDEA